MEPPMTTPDPSRVAFEQWRVQERRNRIPEFQKWPDDVLMVMLNCEPEREWKIWQAAMAHKGADCWQSIETAPKDGTTILLLCTSGGIADGCWDLRDESWNYAYIDPTHWQPLPAAPKQEGST